MVRSLHVPCLVLALSATAGAQINRFDWTLAGAPSGSGSVTASALHVTGPDGGGCTPPATWLQTVAPVAGHVSVQVNFLNLDSGALQDHPLFDAPAAWREGELLKAPTVLPSSASGWPSGSYVLEFEVEALQPFGLGVWSLDCYEGPGVAEFHNLVFTPKVWSDHALELDPRIRFTLAGSQAFQSFPAALAEAGDVDADGTPDLIVASAGEATVHSGADGHVIHAFALPGVFVLAVAGAGDLDHDGHADLVLGAPFDNPGGLSLSGSVRIHSGLTGAELFRVAGTASGDTLGSTVAGMGDADGDGIGDIAVRVKAFTSTPSQVWVLSGAGGAVLHTLVGSSGLVRFGEHLAGAGDADADGHADLAIGGNGQAWLYSGDTGLLLHALGAGLNADVTVDGAGDVDGDGHDDVVVGAPHEFVNGISVGRVRVHSGASGAAILTLHGTHVGAGLGTAVAGGGDLDGDGRLDIAVSSAGRKPAGRVDIHDALDGSLRGTISGALHGDALGASLARLGDVDGDGRDDLAVGAPDGGADDAGFVHVIDSLQHPGPPHLAYSGTTDVGSEVTLFLSNALPGQPAYAVGGLGYAGTPFAGGVLGPTPDVLVGIVTNASGGSVMPFRWPAGLPPMTTLWLQVWTVDPAGPFGFAASNVLSATQL